ncbi:uncharacterized protein JCM6883_007049 [Sporobolomyces salmoneus]|uniref:uncharacterized protein n=1 Tax=Sporobolomyces salmoneus TaxID=183962 RepID=UPI00317890D9
MSSLFAEPVSPYMDFEDDQEPELEGLRNLSVSTDGTLDSLDENPTPPHSPTPIVHITPPGAKFPLTSSNSRAFAFEDHIFDQIIDDSRKKKPSLEPIDPLLYVPFSQRYSDVPPTPDAVKLAFPTISSSPPPATETLAERRASLGKLSNRALLSLQRMRFESSEDAGMGLGVGPPSAGLEGMDSVSPGTKFQLALRMDGNSKTEKEEEDHAPLPKSPLLAAPGIGNYGGQLRRTRSTGSLRSNRSRSTSDRPLSVHVPSSPSTAYSPSSSPRTPASPVVKRSSAFVSANNGPLTPLTPSHVPDAPHLGNSGGAFEYFSFSAPESPVSPCFPPQQQQHQKLAPLELPLTPTSDSGSITPTGSGQPMSFSHHQRGVSISSNGSSRYPSSPLGRDRFDEESKPSSNPFFAASH